MNFNKYINEIDFSEVRKLFLNKGESIDIKKKDYFVRQNEPCKYVGLIQNGIFRYTCIDNEGNEHIVGYSFAKDFVCDYPSLIKNSNSLTNTQSVTDSTVYILSIKELNDYWETNMDTQRFGKLVAEELLIEIRCGNCMTNCSLNKRKMVILLPFG